MKMAIVLLTLILAASSTAAQQVSDTSFRFESGPKSNLEGGLVRGGRSHQASAIG